MRTSLEVDIKKWPEVWQAAYRVLEQSVVSNQLQAWIQPLELIDTKYSDDNTTEVTFEAPNDFSAQWVRDYYQKTIEAAFLQVTGKPCEILVYAKENNKATNRQTSHSENDGSEPELQSDLAETEVHNVQTENGGSRYFMRSEERVAMNSSGRQEFENNLDHRYFFENFIVGASNQFAYTAATAIAEQPAKQYNPLFIYSPPGLGKTHLLYAIGNRFKEKTPSAKVVYLSAEKFVNELIDSLQHKRMSQFRIKYRDSFDMILIDDIQFIAGKKSTEIEFFHTFNTLHSSKRQIVVTCDRPPREIEGLEERIRTRFEWGLVADISPPEIETRIAILKSKAEREDIYLPDDVAIFLASHIKADVRKLEGALVKLQAHASLTGAEITLEMARQEFKTMVPEEGTHITIEAIQNAVVKYFNLKSQDFKSTTRARNVALPRQVAMYLIRKYTGSGFKEIGHYFGGKNHTTILYACSKIEKELETDEHIRQAVESIQNML